VQLPVIISVENRAKVTENVMGISYYVQTPRNWRL